MKGKEPRIYGFHDRKGEDLLTGILFHCMEENPLLFKEIWKKKAKEDLKNINELKFRLWPEIEEVYPDGLIESEKEKFSVHFENKIEKGKLDDLEEKIKKYLSKKEIKQLLCITPHWKHDIEKKIDKYKGKVYWLSWADVWDICENLKDGKLSRREKNSIDEIQVAMEGEGLKPFRGFDEKFLDLGRKGKLPNKKDFVDRLEEKLGKLGLVKKSEWRKWYVEGKGILLQFFRDSDPWSKDDLHYEVGIDFREENFWVGLDFEDKAIGKYESFEEFEKEFGNKIEEINKNYKENWDLSGVPDLEPKNPEEGYVIRAEIPFENLTDKRLVSKIVKIIKDFEEVLPDLTERLG